MAALTCLNEDIMRVIFGQIACYSRFLHSRFGLSMKVSLDIASHVETTSGTMSKFTPLEDLESSFI